MPVPTIETSQLVLRALTLADAPRIHELASPFEIADTTGHMPHPYLEGMAEEWISTHTDEYERRETAMFGITLRETSEVIGAIGLTLHLNHRRAELGYWIGVPFWNCGYATEATRALIGFGFETLDLNRIYASHFSRNRASGRVMQKAGMTFEGVLREHFVRWNNPEDLVYYGILRSEWESMISKLE
jgi:RimJ/RimL family protein N-acetyltransferase